MQKVILKRLLQLIPTLLVVITFTFAATRLIPGDPVAAMLGEQYDATKVDALREELGLNDPIPVQFGHYLVDILHGDFGDSYYFNTSAMNMIKARLPNTLMLSVTSLCIAILVGVFFGVISARRQSSILDYALTVISLFGVSAPVFWVAISRNRCNALSLLFDQQHFHSGIAITNSNDSHFIGIPIRIIAT